MKDPITSSQETIRRIGGYLHRVVPVLEESTGRVLSYAITPLRVELRPRDLMQIALGALLLTLPVAITEEAWVLAEEMPGRNILILGGLSVGIIALFAYTHTYRGHLHTHGFEFCKRVIATYLISAIVAAGMLTLFEKCPWTTDLALALRRVVLVTFPASLAATIYDSLK